MSDSIHGAGTIPAREVAPVLKADVAQDAAATDAGKPPARPPDKIRAELAEERAALGASFEALRADLGEAVDGGRERISAAGRRARIVGPAVGAALAVALVLRSRSRRRR
jgi:hypothetical protein